jgi:DNA ligase (NAD+)
MGVAEEGEETREIETPKVCPYCGSEIVQQGVTLFL